MSGVHHFYDFAAFLCPAHLALHPFWPPLLFLLPLIVSLALHPDLALPSITPMPPHAVHTEPHRAATLTTRSSTISVPAVVTRKNAYGSRTGDAARLAARIWTVAATAEMAGLNVLTYLTAYLDACGRNGGKPLSGSGLERFLPWNAVPADLRAWAQPPPPG